MNQEALLSAASAGKVDVLLAIHGSGGDIRFDHDAPLRRAAANGHLDVVHYLHQNGASIRALDDAPLVEAAANGHLDVVRYLCEAGVPLAQAGLRALLRACAGGHLHVVRYLHRKGAPLLVRDDAALQAAVDGNHSEIVQYLREIGCAWRNETGVVATADRDSDDRCPGSIVLPAVTGQLDRVAELHEDGVLRDGLEACVLAAANGQLGVLEFLHRAGCNIDRISDVALRLAAANGRTAVVDYLCRRTSSTPDSMATAIQAAASKGHLSVVQQLHQAGAEILSCRSVADRVPLGEGHQPLVQYLDRHGAFPDGLRFAAFVRALWQRNHPEILSGFAGIDTETHGRTLVSIIAQKGDLELMRMLHQRGLDIRVDDDLALRLAAEKGHLPLLIYLHQNGADIHACGEDALTSAAIAGHLRVVIYLVECGADISRIDAETLALVSMSGHARVFRYLTGVGVDAIATERPAIDAMVAEVNGAAPVYRPSKLWEFFNQVNLEQLRSGGIASFKRSVNQNYFNFVPGGLFDPQLLALLNWWTGRLTLTWFDMKLIDPDIDPRDGCLVPINSRVFTMARRSRLAFALALKLGLDPGRRLQLGLYRWLISMLRDFVAAHDRLGLADKLAEPRLGSPIETLYRGRLISQDLCHSILEFNSLAPALNELGQERRPRIAEIGAGYGRLGYVILHAFPCQYLVFDIAPSLAISQWYLSQVFAGKRVFRFRQFDRFESIASELASADIAFFTANQIELLPDGYVDVSVNISSLHEMRPDQIAHMLTQMCRITAHFVYLKQYRRYVNPYDGLTILEDNFRVGAPWRNRVRQVDAADSRFFEALWEKEASARSAVQDSPAPVTSCPSATEAGDVPLPTVSVLLANFNHAQYLPTALAGICGQTLPASEIIIVDDGSTDGSVEVIEEYARRFPSIRLLRNPRNRGQHYSIQRALHAARGDYVVWAASDDLLLPRFLEHTVSLLRRYPEAGLCFSQLAVFVDGTTEVRHFTKSSHGDAFHYGHAARYMAPDQLLATLDRHYVWISGNTVLARRSALLEIGGFESSLRWHADWFAYYVIALRYGACVVPQTLALMRERTGTYSAGGISDPQQQYKVLSAILNAIKSPKYRDLLPVFIRHPSLLSLFGKQGIYAALRNPRHWRIAWALARWHEPRYLDAKYGQLLAWLARR